MIPPDKLLFGGINCFMAEINKFPLDRLITISYNETNGC